MNDNKVQALDDGELDAVSGGTNGVDRISPLDPDKAKAEMDAIMQQLDSAAKGSQEGSPTGSLLRSNFQLNPVQPEDLQLLG